jgi:hypothetical protein
MSTKQISKFDQFKEKENVKAKLLYASREGNEQEVARLLAAGADPNASVPGRNPSGEVFQYTALYMAAGNGRLEVLRLLLDAGADPSRGGSTDFTPLMIAAGKGNLEVLRLLLARGAAVDAVRSGDGGTAFHSACYNGHAECAEALARAGCDVGLKDRSGRTGREHAEEQGHAAVVERLRAVVMDRLRAAGPAEVVVQAMDVPVTGAMEEFSINFDRDNEEAVTMHQEMAADGGSRKRKSRKRKSRKRKSRKIKSRKRKSRKIKSRKRKSRKRKSRKIKSRKRKSRKRKSRKIKSRKIKKR